MKTPQVPALPGMTPLGLKTAVVKNVNGREIKDLVPQIVEVRFDELDGFLIRYRTSVHSNASTVLATVVEEKQAMRMGENVAAALGAKFLGLVK